MITIKDLSKTYRTPSGSVTPVKDINLTIEEGVMAAIVGRSGSGKSTLLSLLGGLDTPSQGTIEVAGHQINRMSSRHLTHYRRQHIGFVFQSFYLIPNLTALENAMLPMEYAGLPSDQRKKRAQDLLNQVGLGDKTDRLPSRLSGGEQQRVAIARSLANKPKLILADEPTGNLDSQTGQTIIKLLHQLSQSQHTTIVVVTHDSALAKAADQTFTLVDGQIKKGQVRLS